MPDKNLTPLDLQPPNPLLRPVGLIFTIIAALIFAVIVSIGGWNIDNDSQIPQKTLPPIEESVQKPAPASNIQPSENFCGGVTVDEVQSCCAQWADSVGVMKPECVGTWNVSAVGKCSWECQVSPADELTFEENQLLSPDL